MKHIIPIGTKVAFEGIPSIVIIDQYQDLLYCEEPCAIPHESDCFREPYVSVRVQHWTTVPLSKLRTIFDNDVTHVGRKPTKAELTPIH